MIAVTIAVGDEYQALARLAVESCRRCTGLDPIVITDTEGVLPAFYKLRLLDIFPGETVFYFDADARFLRPWDVHEFANHPYPIAVLDWPSEARRIDCERYGLEQYRYFASGFWIANDAHSGVWRAAAKIAFSESYQTAFKYEQTALNTAVQHAALPITILDRRFFWVPIHERAAPQSTYTVALGGSADGPNRKFYDEAIARAAT